jgi:hypothetical protein
MVRANSRAFSLSVIPEPATKLDRGCQFTALLEGFADRGSIGAWFKSE